MSRQAKLAIPRAAMTGQFVDVQKTFPLSSAQVKKLNEFLEGYSQTQAMKKLKSLKPGTRPPKGVARVSVVDVLRQPSNGKFVLAKKKAKTKGRRSLSLGKG